MPDARCEVNSVWMNGRRIGHGTLWRKLPMIHDRVYVVCNARCTFQKGIQGADFFPVQLCILMDRNIIPHPVASIHYTHFSDELVSKTDAFLQYQWVHHCKHFRLLFIFSAEKKLLLHEKPIIFCLTLSRYCTEIIIFGAKIPMQQENLSWGSKTLHVIR